MKKPTMHVRGRLTQLAEGFAKGDLTMLCVRSRASGKDAWVIARIVGREEGGELHAHPLALVFGDNADEEVERPASVGCDEEGYEGEHDCFNVNVVEDGAGGTHVIFDGDGDDDGEFGRN